MRLGQMHEGMSVTLTGDNYKSRKAIQIGREGVEKEQCKMQLEAGLGEIVMDLVFLLRVLVHRVYIGSQRGLLDAVSLDLFRHPSVLTQSQPHFLNPIEPLAFLPV